jgi:hypothetical protein
MSTREARRSIADAVRKDLAIENELTPAQARLFIRCIQTSWRVPTIGWRDGESVEHLADARRLLHVAQIYRSLDGEDSPEARLCYRRAGELLEWLARANDKTQNIAPIALHAAAAYQLGGQPAMASALFRQAELAQGYTSLYANFLQADFDAVLRDCATFW